MRRALLVSLVLAALLGCGNAGEDRLLGVAERGVFKGLIYFDLNGDRQATVGDDSVRNMTVRLVTLNGTDTVASATTAINGQFRVGNVPVGTYRVVLDTTPLVDTARIVQQDSLQVTILPQDSVFVVLGTSYPHVSIRAASTTVPTGRRVFVTGVLLNSPFNFRDTTMHIQDTSGAMRAARIISTPAGVADSVRLRATIGIRNPGAERVLDVVTTFIIAPSFLPAATVLTTAQAAQAQGGTRHAQQVQILAATVSDTAPATPDFRVTVNDGSGPLDVILDATADPVFVHPFGVPASRPIPAFVIPGNKFNIVGLLVPSGTPGIWRLKPRSSVALVQVP